MGPSSSRFAVMSNGGGGAPARARGAALRGLLSLEVSGIGPRLGGRHAHATKAAGLRA
jgi:hypothetical protein